jgi:hypothetical protein
MKITKSQLKQIIKEELERVMEQEESLKVPEGSAGQQFIDAVSIIQDVLRKYELEDYAGGTYDPMGSDESLAAWERYKVQWKLVVADETFKEARESLLGLIVVKDSKNLRIEDVDIPKGDFEANSYAYIVLADGTTMMIGEDYANLHNVTSVENPQ